MKKFILAVISLSFLVGSAAFVNAADNPREEIKKSIEEMNKLVEKYNKASEKKKPAIEKEIKKKVEANYEKQLKRMEERTEQMEKRLTEMKANLIKMKTEEEKTKKVEKITKKILNGEKPRLFEPPWMGKPQGMQGHKHHGEMKGPHHKCEKCGKWKEHKGPKDEMAGRENFSFESEEAVMAMED